MAQDKKFKTMGYTLIELLIVLGILGVIFSIVLIAINPIEHVNQAHDVTTKAIAQDFSTATTTYFTDKQSLPWQTDTTCKNELTKGPTIKDVPTCVKDIASSSQLQSKVIAQDQAKDIYISECNHAIALCYHPRSQLFGKSSDAKYTKNGALDPNCPNNGKSDECYSCTFSTNNAQECFEALNPNGNLAYAPSPSPKQLLPIPNRHSKDACNTPVIGQVSCMANVVTDSSGTPLSSINLPAGFGPNQIHSAYNLPCTPHGPIASPCAQPTSFGPQTIAIVDAFGTPTLATDLEVYDQMYALPSCTQANGCLTIVNQNGLLSPLPAVNSDWALETSLDVEIAHAVCQTCKILVVQANTNTLTDLGIAVNTAAAMGANAISNSYGTWDTSALTVYDPYYAHRGVFVTVSSGDSAIESYPAASKDVIAVGGTTLSLFADNTYSSESAWSGSGSGCSPNEFANSFQLALPNWGSTYCGNKRSVADVSAVADPKTGVAIYDSTPYSGNSGWWILGGTSVSSPLIASALLLETYAPNSTESASFLYANPHLFRDVVAGWSSTCIAPDQCPQVGYDGPTGLGSINLLSLVNAPQPTPTPTSIPPTPFSCSTVQTVTLSQPDPTIALPGDTINNVLIVTNNDSVGCSTTFTVSQGYPTDWVINGIPTSFTLAGGSTKYIPFTLQVPITATPGTYTYQFWAAKQGQTTINPINGTIQVVSPAPTNTPTPTPINCNVLMSRSLGSTSLSGKAGDTLQESITFTNNNPQGCSRILVNPGGYGEPAGWTVYNYPYGIYLNSGETKTFPFTITISTGAQIQDYTLDFAGVNQYPNLPLTVHVTATSPAPTQQMFSNFGGHQYGNYATFEFSYNQYGSSEYRLDVATNAAAFNTTPLSGGQNATISYGFAYAFGNGWDASNNATPTSVRGFINSSPTSWSGWKCGATIYYRMYNAGDLRIASPIQSTVVDCNTVVDVLPWSPWYSAIYQGVYDSRYDPDNNGIIDWNDYWILVRATRLR